MTLADIRHRAAINAFRGAHFGKRAFRHIVRRLRRSARWPEPSKTRHDRLVRAACDAMAIHVDELPYGFLRMSKDGTTIYSSDFNFSFESLTAYWLCGDKHLTSLMLRQADIPVPEFAVFAAKDVDAALHAFESLPAPLVVKPCFGAGGDGVTVGVRTLGEFRRACYRAATIAGRIIVERLVTGRHWRVTVFDGQLIFACERLAAHITGDGRSTIRELVHRRNNAIRMRDGFPSAYPIRIDRETRCVLRNQGMTPRSVPEMDQVVVLKRICNAAAGGLTADVSSRLHSDYLDLARRAATTMGARLSGVDIIAPDITAPIADNSAFVNEVNTTPDLLLNHFDVSGAGNAVASVRRLLTMAFAVL